MNREDGQIGGKTQVCWCMPLIPGKDRRISMIWGPAWSTQQALGQPEIHREKYRGNRGKQKDKKGEMSTENQLSFIS